MDDLGFVSLFRPGRGHLHAAPLPENVGELVFEGLNEVPRRFTVQADHQLFAHKAQAVIIAVKARNTGDGFVGRFNAFEDVEIGEADVSGPQKLFFQ